MKLTLVNVTGAPVTVGIDGASWVVPVGTIEAEVASGVVLHGTNTLEVTSTWGGQVVLLPGSGGTVTEGVSLLAVFFAGFFLMVGVALSGWMVRTLRFAAGHKVAVPEI